MRNKPMDLTGQKFGRLTALRMAPYKRWPKWECLCDCGNTHITLAQMLRQGHTRSCGCLNRDVAIAKATTHGQAGKNPSREYRSWSSMKERCNGKYKKRGISVDPELMSFEVFFSILGPCPSGMTLDRIDNDKPYQRDNIRWANGITQARNTSRNRFITANGITCTLAEWSERTGLTRTCIEGRIDRLNWSPDRAINTPLLRKRRNFGLHLS